MPTNSWNYEKNLLPTDADTNTLWKVLGHMLYIGPINSPIILHRALAMACRTSDPHLQRFKQLSSVLSR